jgi:hypothetical protein
MTATPRSPRIPAELRELAVGLRTLRAARLKFAAMHRDEHGRALSFEGRPFLQQIYADDAQELVISKAVQIGISTRLLVEELAAAATLGLTSMHCFPRGADRVKFVASRVDLPLQRVKFYRELLDAADSPTDNRNLKHFGRGIIQFIHSNSVSEFTETPADIVVIDEFDQCSKAHLDLLDDRLTASRYKLKRKVGNPTIDLPDTIAAAYAASDQKVWLVPCPACGHEQELDWWANVVCGKNEPDCLRPRDEKWQKNCGRDLLVFCAACGKPLNRTAAGVWRARRKGERVSGYRTSNLILPTVSVAELYRRWRQVYHDQAKRAKFIRMRLGLPCSEGGGGVTEEMLSAARRDYALPFAARATSAGIDVGSFFHVRISDAPAEHPYARRAVYVGRVKTKAELLALLERFGVVSFVMDSQPETRIAKEVVAARAGGWLARFKTSDDDLRELEWDAETRVCSTPRTFLLDQVRDSFAAGLNWLPRNWQYLDGGDFSRQMQTPKRVQVDDRHGNKRWVWTKGVDHYYLADAYDWAARQRLGGHVAPGSVYGAGKARMASGLGQW